MRKLFIYLMFVMTLSLGASEIKWAKDFNDGIAEAKKVNKPVLFVSSRHSCKFCVILDETTFKDKRVIEELNKNFVSIISYSDENDYMPKELWQPGTPAIWFLFPNAEPMYQPLMGAIDAENFLKAADIVKEEFNKQRSKK
jgi:thioredoxin-related protein